MKAGTTSLAADLQRHPAICFPAVKEPHFLTSDAPLEVCRRRYAQLYRRAEAGQLCGEASTGYTKLPRICGVPERALAVLGPRTRLIYMVRNPIARAISHHYHLIRNDRAPVRLAAALERHGELVDFGRYAMQLAPWLEAYERANLLVVRFEDYVARPERTLGEIFRFLDLEPLDRAAGLGRVRNRGEDVRIPHPFLRGLARRVTSSPLYMIHLRPRIPRALRKALKVVATRQPAARPAPPERETIRLLADRFREDADRLRTLLGRDEPLWDLDEESP